MKKLLLTAIMLLSAGQMFALSVGGAQAGGAQAGGISFDFDLKGRKGRNVPTYRECVPAGYTTSPNEIPVGVSASGTLTKVSKDHPAYKKFQECLKKKGILYPDIYELYRWITDNKRVM
ncbi:MAG: hypothetical protein WD055_03890 [Candidatus Dependentiae bacterium]